MSDEHEPAWPYVGEPARLATVEPSEVTTNLPREDYRLRVHGAPDLHQHLQRLLTNFQHADWWDGASVFVTMPGDVTLASAGTSQVTAADELQLRLDEGPALSTLVTRCGVVVEDTASERRWPAWSAAMASSGWRSVLTMPVGSVSVDEGSAGALCLYASRPGAFPKNALAGAEALAQRARTVVSTVLELLGPCDEHDAESDVTSAILRVMDRRSLDQYDAFDWLCDLAETQQAPLTTTASAILAGRHGLA